MFLRDIILANANTSFEIKDFGGIVFKFTCFLSTFKLNCFVTLLQMWNNFSETLKNQSAKTIFV